MFGHGYLPVVEFYSAPNVFRHTYPLAHQPLYHIDHQPRGVSVYPPMFRCRLLKISTSLQAKDAVVLISIVTTSLPQRRSSPLNLQLELRAVDMSSPSRFPSPDIVEISTVMGLRVVTARLRAGISIYAGRSQGAPASTPFLRLLGLSSSSETW